MLYVTDSNTMYALIPRMDWSGSVKEYIIIGPNGTQNVLIKELHPGDPVSDLHRKARMFVSGQNNVDPFPFYGAAFLEGIMRVQFLASAYESHMDGHRFPRGSAVQSEVRSQLETMRESLKSDLMSALAGRVPKVSEVAAQVYRTLEAAQRGPERRITPRKAAKKEVSEGQK